MHDTASTRMMTSGYLARTSLAISAIGLRMPVEVSFMVRQRVSKPPLAKAASTSSGVIALPGSTSIVSAGRPLALEISNQRRENSPLMVCSTFFPTQLRTTPSMTPVEEEVKSITRPSVLSSFLTFSSTDLCRSA